MKNRKKKSSYKKGKIETANYASLQGSFVLWNSIFDTLNRHTKEKDRLFFSIDMIPPSTNELYKKSIYKNKKTGRMFLSVKNIDEVEILRIKVKQAISKTGKKFSPKGTVAVVIMIESPKWLNKDRTPRKIDIDNNLKSLLDAIEKATGVPDELNFQIMAFKVPSDVEKTRVYMYSLEEKYYSLEQ